ncbi:MAG: type transport system ATP-binding protein [Solirubrobacteraceae bacterium]|nr:type transport system ATP-binding protein [Solirubrobacteraceae bacterium]
MLELDALSRRYGEVVALDDLNLSVPDGTICGFVGPNGAGKTTAMRIVLGVLAADSGEVRWAGRPVDAASRARFGYMPEERGLYPKMRTADQLQYFARLHGVTRGDAPAAAARWIERLGLEGRARDRVEALSLGNQQRVQLAAALVHDPAALVLDEPFSGLDPHGVDVMSEVLRERAADGVPVLFSSHQLELVERLCDTVAIIKDGRLVAAGAVAELRARGGGGAWRVVVRGAPADWAQRVHGARVVSSGGRGVLVVLEHTDEQALLDAARAAGRVCHFAREEPTLADLFRGVIAA